MRLLNVDTLKFKQFYTSPPPYVIASHRWADEADEITYQDVLSGNDKSKAGYKKLEGFLSFIRGLEYPVKWLWIDTCCIDKMNAVELSEAINCMFKWYKEAEVCLAYLEDVFLPPILNERGWVDELRRSEWFTRGWTLQELLAPRTVVFLTVDWQVIGHKGEFPSWRSCETNGLLDFTFSLATHQPLEATIASFTNVPESILTEPDQLESSNAEDCLRWAIGRNTTREEDMWYCLFGLLNTPIGANYGEGARRARKRLLAELEDIGSIGKGRAAVLAYQFDHATPPPHTRGRRTSFSGHDPRESGTPGNGRERGGEPWAAEHPEPRCEQLGGSASLARMQWFQNVAGRGRVQYNNAYSDAPSMDIIHPATLPSSRGRSNLPNDFDESLDRDWDDRRPHDSFPSHHMNSLYPESHLRRSAGTESPRNGQIFDRVSDR